MHYAWQAGVGRSSFCISTYGIRASVFTKPSDGLIRIGEYPEIIAHTYTNGFQEKEAFSIFIDLRI